MFDARLWYRRALQSTHNAREVQVRLTLQAKKLPSSHHLSLYPQDQALAEYPSVPVMVRSVLVRTPQASLLPVEARILAGHQSNVKCCGKHSRPQLSLSQVRLLILHHHCQSPLLHQCLGALNRPERFPTSSYYRMMMSPSFQNNSPKSPAQNHTLEEPRSKLLASRPVLLTRSLRRWWESGCGNMCERGHPLGLRRRRQRNSKWFGAERLATAAA